MGQHASLSISLSLSLYYYYCYAFFVHSASSFTLSGNGARSCLPVARPLPALAVASSSFAVEVGRRPPSVVAFAHPPPSVVVGRKGKGRRRARMDRLTATSRDTRDTKSGRNTVPRRGGASRCCRPRPPPGGPWRRRRSET